MADTFNKAGIPSEFLIAESDDEVRDSVKRRLVNKEINFVFENIRDAINNKRNLIGKLHDLMEIKSELKVGEFFEVYHVNPQDVYSKKISVVGLAAQAGLLKGYELNQEREKLISFCTRKAELMDLLEYQYVKIDFVDKPLDMS